ncbi:MAG TPA: protein kinase [Blastocatellia bacterium]|nr:protein kinase [Blastocatellia bacterium]
MLPQKISHYRILGQLGAGGMGEVYLAEDERLGRKVALKLLPARFTADAELVRRFEQEARAASALNHPNILTIYEVGRADGVHFIAAEYIEGQTLRQRLATGRMSVPDALDVASQIASALNAAHSAGIVHRDIKPENVMLRHDSYVKVLDFGLAKVTERFNPPAFDPEAPTIFKAETNPGTVMGTASYMSPEQARGLKVDHRTDIFSLGIVLYEMIAGRQPFTGPTTSDVLVAILQSDPAPLSQSNASVPPALERSIFRALSRNSDERYQTASELLSDLKRFRQRLEFESEATAIWNAGQTLPEITEELSARSIRSSPSARRTRSRKAIDSLAVLPLANASNDPNLEYLAEGITESIINSLSQLPKLRVIPRGTVFLYKGRAVDPQQAGHELGVRAVLSGRMLQVGETLVIRAELNDVVQHSQLWGEQYRRKLTDIFELQEEIAQEISEKLRFKLSGEEKKKLVKRYTENTEAYHLYLKGRYFTSTKRTEEWIKKGIEHFQQAIDLDPNYALAYAGLADAYAFLASSTGGWRPREAYPKAKAAASKALELDEQLAEAHCSLGFAALLFDWDFAEAERQFKRAIELNPNYANAHDGYGFYLKATGQHEASIRSCRQASGLDPLSHFAALSCGWAYYFARRFDEASEQGLKVLEMDPNFAFAWKFLGMSYGQQGATDAAIDALEKAVALAEDVPDFKAHLGHVYGLAGNRAAAERVIEELEQIAKQRYVPSYYFALVALGMGEMDQAFRWFEKACEERSGFLVYLGVEPMLDRLRSDARFENLLRHVGVSSRG